MENQWIVNAKDEYVINARTECDYWRIRVKADGCMEWEHSFNDPIEEAQADDVDRMHICSLATFAELVLHAALMVKQEWSDNDAVEDAEKALIILAKAVKEAKQ